MRWLIETRVACAFSAIGHYRIWNHANCECDAEREQNQSVEMTNDWNWIRNQIDWAKRVGDDAHDQQPRQPRSARVGVCEPKRMKLTPQSRRLLRPFGQQFHD